MKSNEEKIDDLMMELSSFYYHRMENRPNTINDIDLTIYEEETDDMAEEKFGHLLSMEQMESAENDAEEHYQFMNGRR